MKRRRKQWCKVESPLFLTRKEQEERALLSIGRCAGQRSGAADRVARSFLLLLLPAFAGAEKAS
ncbi:hypothetical protein ACSS6W_006339 [Trichoderma asperelloides]